MDLPSVLGKRLTGRNTPEYGMVSHALGSGIRAMLKVMLRSTNEALFRLQQLITGIPYIDRATRVSIPPIPHIHPTNALLPSPPDSPHHVSSVCLVSFSRD
jgi:hypothetical protein